MSEHPLQQWLGDAATGEYWRRLQDGTVCASRCVECGTWQVYRQWICHGCRKAGTTVWEPVGPTGRVYSVTLQHRAPAGFDLVPPFQVALVELDEGPVVLACVAAGERVAIGDAVRIGVREVGGAGRLSVIRPGEARPRHAPLEAQDKPSDGRP